ncbi:sugar phosphate isomerase/epimerase family protein [Hespellia stercorisuis]|uniref:Sugar phosphate isomerase/epimerase n=1 Tax=Hespellia stercorisuis DSM 15480 TaxID=1121950 RepID=A0A1M6KBI1_9FIRM|nr:TIM barrel protein [Hespellia stercorisuis]SHJ56229.1 Sugar phosphate isomerase/epimerase [Hespellia stercorisuis DSM 15480]
MKDSIHKYFQIGTIRWMSHPQKDVVESVHEIACDDFFDAIEICQFTDDEVREKVRKMLNQSHMQVCYGAQPRLLGPKLNPNAIDENERQKAEKTLKEAIDEANYLGAENVAFLAGKWEEKTKEEAYNQLLKTTKNICSYAGKKGMGVNLEVFDYDMDKAVLIGPAPLAARFAADMRSYCNNFGLLVDLSHFPTTYETSRFVIQTLRPYIRHFHIGNAVVEPGVEAYGDQHPRFGFPHSANDVPELLDFFHVLKNEGFFCSEKPYVLSFEVKPWADEDADIVLANTKRVINRAWALLED